MGQIAGKDSDFPTIKQVNDALSDGELPLVEINDVNWLKTGVAPFGNIAHYRAAANQSQIAGHVIDSSNVANNLPKFFLCKINNIQDITGIENTSLLFVKQNKNNAIPSRFDGFYNCSGVNSNGTYFTINLNISRNIFSSLVIDYFALQKTDNPSSAGNTELDISQYATELFNLTDTEPNNNDSSIGSNEYLTLTNQQVIEMLEEIIKVKPNILKGKLIDDQTLIEFITSNVKWSIVNSENEGILNQFIISFNIYISYLTACYHFVLFKSGDDNYTYSKYLIDANGF